MDSAILESVNEPSGEIKNDSEDEEGDTIVTTSLTLLGESESLGKLKTFVVKQKGVPDALFKSIDEVEKCVNFQIFKRQNKFLIIS
jgi:hypothetical protein